MASRIFFLADCFFTPISIRSASPSSLNASRSISCRSNASVYSVMPIDFKRLLTSFGRRRLDKDLFFRDDRFLGKEFDLGRKSLSDLVLPDLLLVLLIELELELNLLAVESIEIVLCFRPRLWKFFNKNVVSGMPIVASVDTLAN